MELTQKELETLAAQASFIKERLQGKITTKRENNELFQLWQKKAGGKIGLENFQKRLLLDGITEQEAPWILNNVCWNQNYDLPNWLETIKKIISLFPMSPKQIADILILNVTNVYASKQYDTVLSNNIFLKDMLDAILPFLYVAEQELIKRLDLRKSQFTKEAIGNFSEILAKKIICIGHNVFKEELSSYIDKEYPFFFLGSQDTKSFIPEFTDLLLAGAWKNILIKYPVFARLLAMTIDNWINFIIELSTCLDKDKEKLMETFNGNEPLGKLIEVKGELCNSQSKGKIVLILKFAVGVKIVFKPRDLSVDLEFPQFLNWLYLKKFPYVLKTPKALNYHTYGWCEYIEHIPLDNKREASDFYRRAGVLLGLLYIFRGNDFHSGNLIAWGSHPVLIDIETLINFKIAQFYQETKSAPTNVHQRVARLMNTSVLKIGFLPSCIIRANEEPYDFGALTDKQNKNMPYFKEGGLPNIKEYQRELLEGFAAIYHFFLENRTEIKEFLLIIFNDCQLRAVLRNTSIYIAMQIHTKKTCFLDNGAKYSMEIERFAPAFLNYVPFEKAQQVWKIFLSERDQLEDLDLPIFYGYSNKRALWDKDKLLYDSYFEKSALEQLNEAIDQMNLEDLERQMDFIRGSLNIYRKDVHNAEEKGCAPKSILWSDQEDIGEELLRKEAVSIYEQILDQAIKDHQDMTWIVYRHYLNNNLIRIRSIDYSLYDGFFGISLFMAALFQLNKEEPLKQNALGLIETTCAALNEADFSQQHFPLDYGRGLAGILDALLFISDYLKEDSLIDYALNLISKIEQTSLQKETNIGVLNGLAGLVLILVKYYQRFKNDYALELATLGAKELLKNNSENISTGGFLNGTSGILYTQLKVYSITGNKQFYDAAIEMLQDEDNHLESITKHGLYNGLAGVGLARLGVLNIINDSGLKASQEKIINLLLTNPLGNSDHLCCGNMGRIHFLIEASKLLNRPELLKEARKMLWWLIQRQKQNAHYLITGGDSKFISNPSFFQGLSGIGYEILRSINPNKVQSIFL